MRAGEPEFVAEDKWLERHAQELLNWADTVDEAREGTGRVPPMAFVRCSRGGKTRVLRELSRKLRQLRPELGVIYVTFNNYSPLHHWEHSDAVDALCRRIAFAALRQKQDTDLSFDAFRATNVTVADIESFLGDTPCVLLIDELNVLNAGGEQAIALAGFLKHHFLFGRGRYFAFSSHVAPTGKGMAEFFDAVSERDVFIRELPLIPAGDLVAARSKLQFPSLTVRQAVFRGRIPALVSYTRGEVPPEFLKRAAAIAEVTPKWNDSRVRTFLASFLVGDPNPVFVFTELLQLMNVVRREKLTRLTWIPYHMVHVLDSIANTLVVSVELRAAVSLVSDCLKGFETDKTSGGDTWEALFVAVLLIRAVSGHFHAHLLPLDAVVFANCRVFYNDLWKQQDCAPAFPDIQTVDQLLAGIQAPPSFPAIALYYPPHARFQTYDCFFVAWSSAEERKVFGYQLKEGKQIPNKAPNHCEQSFWIRGDLSSSVEKRKGWVVADDAQVDDFLGISGAALAPKEWRRLK